MGILCGFFNPSVPDSPVKGKCEGLQVLCGSKVQQLKRMSSFIVTGSHVILEQTCCSFLEQAAQGGGGVTVLKSHGVVALRAVGRWGWAGVGPDDGSGLSNHNGSMKDEALKKSCA